ncbi:MAG: phage portal protein [Clostridia bacterium]|nr:phage portal protein [Clostridia bacterium]
MLRFSEDKLEEEKSISALFSSVSMELEARKKLYAEFRRKLTDEELASLDDNDMKVPLQRYLSVMAVGFFAGKPPVYKVHAYDEEIDKLNQDLFDKSPNDEEKVKEMEFIIKHVTDYNDDGKEFFSLAFDYFVKRGCYEILYKNSDSEIVYSKSDALETVAIWDYSVPKNLIGLYRLIRTTLANGEYQQMVELTTKSGKRYYMDTPEKRKLFGTDKYEAQFKDEPLFKEDKKKAEPNKWNDLQVIALENEHGLNIFENVDSLISGYERVIQNSRNTFKYNDEAILAVSGYTPENPMTIENEKGQTIINPARKLEDEYVLTSKVRYLQEGGKLEWILKQVNDNALQNHKKTLMDLICLCSFIPNMTDLGFTQADNNSALEKKFFALQQLITDAESDFKMGLLRRWELIFSKFNQDKGKEYDFRNVEITLQRNMPSDSSSETSRALSLRDLLSDETIIGMLPDDLDPKNEIAKKQTESEDNMLKNIERMKAFKEQGANIDDASIQEQTGKDEISTMKDDREIVKEVNAKQQENQEKEEKEIKEEDIKKK